jgi:serine/threonine-protein kinase
LTLPGGAGPRGQVFEADRPTYAGPVEVKLYPWGAGLTAGAIREFTRESLIVANLRHPHVVHVIDVGAGADGTPFVVLEPLRGQTLQQRIAGRQVIAPAEVIEIIRGLASALSAAHAAGVVHRELRADNVFIAELAGYPRGFPKLLGFGVGRLTAAARFSGRVVPDRSDAAIAPEQRRGVIDAGDDRSDQFALAALAYLLLTGSAPPFAHAGGPPFQRLWKRPSEGETASAPHHPAGLDAVLRRALAWRPESRFDSIASFFREFEEAAIRASPASALPPAADLPPITPAAQPTAAAAEGTAPVAASLTQQFFAEGDRQERAQAQGAASEQSDDCAEDGASDGYELARSATFDSVPRRRAPLIAAAALASVSVAVLGWAWASSTSVGDDDEPAEVSVGTGLPSSTKSKATSPVVSFGAPSPASRLLRRKPAGPRPLQQGAQIPRASASTAPSTFTAKAPPTPPASIPAPLPAMQQPAPPVAEAALPQPASAEAESGAAPEAPPPDPDAIFYPAPEEPTTETVPAEEKPPA